MSRWTMRPRGRRAPLRTFRQIRARARGRRKLTELTPEKGWRACPYGSAVETGACTGTSLFITTDLLPDMTACEATDADRGEAARAAGLPRRGPGLPRPGERQAPGAGG